MYLNDLARMIFNSDLELVATMEASGAELGCTQYTLRISLYLVFDILSPLRISLFRCLLMH